MAILPFFYIAFGRKIFSLICKALHSQIIPELPNFAFFVFGLLSHITVSFFLKNVGASWSVATLLPLIPCCFLWDEMKFGFTKISTNFLIWFCVIVAIGFSIFQVSPEGLVSRLHNQDLNYHISMIACFVKADVFPPDDPIFAGHILTYPLFIDFWSAMLWCINPSYESLRLIFVYQWILVWLVIYFALRGERYHALPWVILLAGGDFVFTDHLVFPILIHFVWIQLRSTMLGVAVILVPLYLMYQVFNSYKEKKIRTSYAQMLFASLILGLSPLTHVHICFAGCMFIGLSLAGHIIVKLISYNTIVGEVKILLRFLLCFVAGTSLGCIFLPWMLSGISMLKIMHGWFGFNPTAEFYIIENINENLLFWLQYAHVLFIIFFVFLLASKKYIAGTVLIVMFYFSNTVAMVNANWDHFKIFLGIFVVFLAAWANCQNKTVYKLHYILLFLCIPTIIRFISTDEILAQEPKVWISKKEIDFGKKIEALTPPKAIIATEPNSRYYISATSGRRLYLTEKLFLWTHGIDFSERENILNDFEKFCNCKKVASEKERPFCPDYIVWNAEAKKFWKRSKPCQNAEMVDKYLYKLKY